MTKIKNLEMADAISKLNDITITKTCLGLCEKAVYNPTESRIKAYIFEYSPDNGERLAALLNGKTEDLEKQISHGIIIRHTPVGNIRVEICVSGDRQLMAVNMLRFSNFRYSPMGEVILLRGKNAETASKLFEL